MKIEGNLSLSSLEQAVAEASSVDPGRLRLPIKPRVNSPGVEASLIQAIVTWTRNQPTEPLELYLSDETDQRRDQLDKFIRKQPVGLVSTGMASGVVSIGDDRPLGVQPLIEDHFESFRNPPSRETQMDLFEAEKSEWSESTIPAMGPKLFLACLDHFANGRIPHLYVDKTNLRTRAEFNSLVQTLLRKLSNPTAIPGARTVPFKPELMAGISRIVFELFDNTHKWAVDDADGRQLSSSARGILLKLHTVSANSVSEKVNGTEPLENYFSHWVKEEESLRFIEISIFDSGPGLAARKLRRPLTSNDTTSQEFGAICDCFRKHSTTSNQSGRGLGLYYMMKTLTELNGFVRLRSGRLCLYRDLMSRPVDFREGWFNRAMEDWHGQKDEPTRLAGVEGAVFSILLPLV